MSIRSSIVEKIVLLYRTVLSSNLFYERPYFFEFLVGQLVSVHGALLSFVRTYGLPEKRALRASTYSLAAAGVKGLAI